MTDFVVFNHHSLPFNTIQKAEEEIPEFLRICIKLKTAGFFTILIDESIDCKWYRIMLAENYYWQEWYKKHKKGKFKDLINAFLSLATKSPLFSEIDTNDNVDLYEIVFNGCNKYSALRAASWFETSIVSFATGCFWNQSPLSVIVNYIDENTHEMINKEEGIINFYSNSVFEEELPKLKERKNASLLSGRNIVDRFSELYPNLILCGKAKQQLYNWQGSTIVFEQVKKTLTFLSDYVEKLQKKEIPCFSLDSIKKTGIPFRVSGESETVKNNPILKKERMFWLPDGREEFFEQHIKLTSNYRFYFYPDGKNCIIYVGYIGTHLRLK